MSGLDEQSDFVEKQRKKQLALYKKLAEANGYKIDEFIVVHFKGIDK